MSMFYLNEDAAYCIEVEADEYQEGLAPGYMFKTEVFDLKPKSFSAIRSKLIQMTKYTHV